MSTTPSSAAPGARLYHSGDLGRFAPNGEVEYLGRIDSQVKIRGYRIELAEIEAVLLEDPAVENAIVSTVPKGLAPQDLAAYVTLRRPSGVDDVKARLAAELHRRLPAYMVPAFIEVLDRIPMLPSGKADRKALPDPVSTRLAARAGAYVAPSTESERKLVALWQTVFGEAPISVEDDFFLDLGGHSLFAAQLVSRLRRETEFQHLSVGDLYSHPTIRTLATCAETGRPVPLAHQDRPETLHHSNRRVWTAGLAQFAMLYALLAVLSAPLALLLARHARSHAAFTVTWWDVLTPAILLLGSAVVPVLLKWTLIGRFRPGRHPLWGWYYCRWWLVRKALDFSPVQLLAGSPLMTVYARLLGARIGRGAHIGSGQLHLPDLIEVGAAASIGYEVELQTFAVADGWLELAPIRIGAGAFLGTKAVVMPGADIGPGARVGEQTLVTRGQRIPAGESWSGSPAAPRGPRPAAR